MRGGGGLNRKGGKKRGAMGSLLAPVTIDMETGRGPLPQHRGACPVGAVGAIVGTGGLEKKILTLG